MCSQRSRMQEKGPVEEGAVGAGTGTIAFGFKGGIGTSSRRLPDSLGGYTIGVLVQTNFGGILRIAGVPVAKELGNHYLINYLQQNKGAANPGGTRNAGAGAHGVEREQW